MASGGIPMAQVPGINGAGSKMLSEPAPHFGLPVRSSGAGSGLKMKPAPARGRTCTIPESDCIIAKILYRFVIRM